jgi:hypothetical protein
MAEIDKKTAAIVRELESEIRKAERRIARARRILADPDQLARMADLQLDRSDGAYPWELEDNDPPDQPPRAWAGATGIESATEDLNFSFFATRVRGEAAFRRSFAKHIGRLQADAAWAGHLFSKTGTLDDVVTSEVRAMIRSLAAGTELPAGHAYLIRLFRTSE